MKTLALFFVLSFGAIAQLPFVGAGTTGPSLNNRWFPVEKTCGVPVSTTTLNDLPSASFGAVDFTAAAWLYTTGAATDYYAFGKASNVLGYSVGAGDATHWIVQVRNTGAFIKPTTALVTNTWTLVILRQVAANSKIYSSVNGGAFDAGVAWAGGTSTSNATVKFANGNTTPCKGGIWSRAFTNADAATLYNNGYGLTFQQLPSSLLTGLVGYWNLSSRTDLGTDISGSPTVGYGAGVYEDTNVALGGSWAISITTPAGLGSLGFGPPQPQFVNNLWFDGDSQTDPNGHGTSWAQYTTMGMGPHSTQFKYTNSAHSGDTGVNMAARGATVDAGYSSDYSNNVLLFDMCTNSSGGADMSSCEGTVAAYITARHAKGWKVVVLTIPPTTATGFWTGTNRADYNAWLCTGWTATGSPQTCAAGSSGADLVIDVGNNAALQNPADGINYYADHLHWTAPAKWIVAQQVVPALRAYLGI